MAKSKLAFWQSVACSASGSHLVAVAFGGTIYRSNDAGFNWNEVYYMDSQWMDVTSDMNGINLAAVSVSDGVYYSCRSPLSQPDYITSKLNFCMLPIQLCL